MTSLTYGYEPVKIETPEGRAEYETHQREISQEAAPLRQQIIAVLSKVILASQSSKTAH